MKMDMTDSKVVRFYCIRYIENAHVLLLSTTWARCMGMGMVCAFKHKILTHTHFGRICKGYWPGARGYVIYSPRGVPKGIARGHAMRGIYYISQRDRSIACLFSSW